MLNDDFLDFTGLNQLEQMLKFGSRITHTRADFFIGGDDHVILGLAVGL